MSIKLVLCITLLIAGMASYSQETPDTKVEGRSSFFAEVGGPGILFSANYDTRFKKTNLGWGGRIGLGFVTTWDNTIDSPYYYYDRQVTLATFPVQVNYVFGKSYSPHSFEVGAGITVMSRKLDVFHNNYYNSKDVNTNWYGSFSFMYRRQPANGGFSWRLGFTPLITNKYVQPSAAASVGYNF